MSLSDYVPVECMEFFSNPRFVEALRGFANYLIDEDPIFVKKIKSRGLELIKDDPEYREQAKEEFMAIDYELTIVDQDPNYQCLFDTKLITSKDLDIVNRLANVEEVLGMRESDYDEDEECQQTIPMQITRLNNLVYEINTTLKPELIDRSLVMPSKNYTEIRADYLIEYMKNNKDALSKAVSPFANIDSRVMDSRDFKIFVENYLPEEYRPESTKNLRKLKRDVFDAVEKRCATNDMFIDKADHGRKELRLIFARQIPTDELPAWTQEISGLTVTA
jgi:hypothetical protein